MVEQVRQNPIMPPDFKKSIFQRMTEQEVNEVDKFSVKSLNQATHDEIKEVQKGNK